MTVDIIEGGHPDEEGGLVGVDNRKIHSRASPISLETVGKSTVVRYKVAKRWIGPSKSLLSREVQLCWVWFSIKGKMEWDRDKMVQQFQRQLYNTIVGMRVLSLRAKLDLLVKRSKSHFHQIRVASI